MYVLIESEKLKNNRPITLPSLERTVHSSALPVRLGGPKKVTKWKFMFLKTGVTMEESITIAG